MVMPPTVLGYYLLVLLGKKSALGQFLYNQFGIQLIFMASRDHCRGTIVALPLVYKPARSAFESIDPITRTSGAHTRAFKRGDFSRQFPWFGAASSAASARIRTRARRIWRHADGGR